MKARIIMKQVIVCCVLLYLFLTSFFLHKPNEAIMQPMKAAIRKGKGIMPMSLMVNSTQAVPSLLVFQPEGQALTHYPS